MSVRLYRFDFNRFRMSVHRHLYLLVFPGLCAITTACTGSFGSDFKNTPKGNYDYFFFDLNKTYAYWDYTFDGKTLSQIQSEESSGIDSSWDSLQTALDRVINLRIRDPHLYSKYSPIPDIDLADDTLLKNERQSDFSDYVPGEIDDIDWLEREQFIFFGIVKNSREIGYVFVDSLVDNVGGDQRLNDSRDFGAITDRMLAKFQSLGVEKLIFDIRSPAGGAVHRGKAISSRFVSSQKVFMISEAPDTSGEYERREETISPAGNAYYRDKPLVILTNTNTCSGGEMLVLMLRQADGYRKTIGSSTRGCAGTIIDRELPNGWIIRVTSSRTFMPEKKEYFKVGIEPEQIEQFGWEIGEEDTVLAKAIELLNDITVP